MIYCLFGDRILFFQFLITIGILLAFRETSLTGIELRNGLFISATILLLIDLVKFFSFIYVLPFFKKYPGDISGYLRSYLYFIDGCNRCGIIIVVNSRARLNNGNVYIRCKICRLIRCFFLISAGNQRENKYVCLNS